MLKIERQEGNGIENRTRNRTGNRAGSEIGFEFDSESYVSAYQEKAEREIDYRIIVDEIMELMSIWN